MKAQTAKSGKNPPVSRAVIEAGEQAFTAALARARARGGPRAEIDALCASRRAPRLADGTALSRMTLGIQRLLQKRAAMPGAFDIGEMALYFVRGPAVADCFAEFDEEAQEWRSEPARERYEEMLHELDNSVDAPDAVASWIGRELDDWTRLACGDSGSRSSGSGSSGSRVGWWLRAAEEIATKYGARCPAGVDLLQWAVWHFPLNDYFALAEAALERGGVEVEQHYAVKEARRARSEAKAKAVLAEEAAAPLKTS